MPKLLVSVRSSHEAQTAIDAGVDVIDIKEPSAGALGAASPEVIHEVVRLVAHRRLTSVACGELLESASDIARQLPGADPIGSQSAWPDFVKVGLSGCGSIDDWPQKWRQFLAMIPDRSCPVAVVYADWREADAPPPAEVIEQARALKRAAILIDTFDKAGPGLLGNMSLEVVRALIEDVHDSRMQIAIGGQLTFDDAVSVALAGPDFVAVRGGVCRPNRDGDLDAERLARWRDVVSYPDESRKMSRHA